MGDETVAVLLELLGLERAALEETAGALFHGAAQAVVREGLVALEGDRLDLDLLALVEGDDQVFHVVGVDDGGIGVDLDVAEPLLVVQVAQGLQVALDRRRVRELAHGDGERLPQIFLADLLVAHEVHAADARKFAQVHDQLLARLRALHVDIDLGELLGREQAPDDRRREVGGQGLPRLQAGPGLDLALPHRDRADHLDGRDRLAEIRLLTGTWGGHEKDGQEDNSDEAAAT